MGVADREYHGWCSTIPNRRLISSFKVPVKGKRCDKHIAVYFYYFSNLLPCDKEMLGLNFARTVRNLRVFLCVHLHSLARDHTHLPPRSMLSPWHLLDGLTGARLGSH